MKKLIMAAAIVCAAVVSQAAVVNWGLGSSGKVTFSGTALGAQSVSLYIVGLSGASDLLVDARYTSGGMGKGKLQNGYGTDQTIKYTDTVAGGALWDSNKGDLGRQYYIVLSYNDGETDYTYTSSAVASSGLTDTAMGTVQFTFNDTITSVAGTKDAWVYEETPGPGPEPIPEPTSGLLMLLGMAGLALRRRRA